MWIIQRRHENILVLFSISTSSSLHNLGWGWRRSEGGMEFRPEWGEQGRIHRVKTSYSCWDTMLITFAINPCCDPWCKPFLRTLATNPYCEPLFWFLLLTLGTNTCCEPEFSLSPTLSSVYPKHWVQSTPNTEFSLPQTLSSVYPQHWVQSTPNTELSLPPTLSCEGWSSTYSYRAPSAE